MSRSYKKFPLVKCEKSCKKGKKASNSKVRTFLNKGNEISSGSMFKKIFNSYDICDYYCYTTTKDVILHWQKEEKEILNGVNTYIKNHEALDEALLKWFLKYKRK